MAITDQLVDELIACCVEVGGRHFLKNNIDAALACGRWVDHPNALEIAIDPVLECKLHHRRPNEAGALGCVGEVYEDPTGILRHEKKEFFRNGQHYGCSPSALAVPAKKVAH